VTEVTEDKEVSQARQEVRASKDQEDQEAQWDQQDVKEQRVLLVCKVNKDPQESKAEVCKLTSGVLLQTSWDLIFSIAMKPTLCLLSL